MDDVRAALHSANKNCTGPVEDTERAALLAWNTRAPILSGEEMLDESRPD